MDKRFGPRSAERRAQMSVERWGSAEKRQKQSALYSDPEYLARWNASKRAGAINRLPARFWASVPYKPEAGCWEWAGCREKRGYGVIRIINKTERAHRVSWFLENGSYPADGHIIRHKCDNPSCVRPDHLELGDHRSNAHDRVHRNRTTQAKLTVAQVQEIRSLSHLPSSEVAALFGIHRDTAKNIMAGRCWKSVPWPAL